MKNINEAYEPRYLVCVTSDNHNKFWRAIPDADQQGFTAEWGRIGANSVQSKHYPISMYDRKIGEKLNKGYVDQTHLMKVAVDATGEDGFKAIADKDVNALVRALRRYANETIKQNYTISQDAVTQDMLDAAKNAIDELNKYADELSKSSDPNATMRRFNNSLIYLFKTIPRKMSKVQLFLLQSPDASEAAKIIDREQKLYDVLLANFQTQQASTTNANTQNTASTSAGPTETILEKFGLECKLVDDQAKIDDVKKQLGSVASNFKRLFVVVNKKTQDKYTSLMNANPSYETKLFFHGSKNENFWSILKNGLLLNPNAATTGKMLGLGLYFSPLAAKSLNYTSLRGTTWANGNSNIAYMAIFAVGLDPNNYYNVTTQSMINSCHGLNWNKLQKLQPGATYVYAHGGLGYPLRADELCIYREEQCTIRYLVELTV